MCLGLGLAILDTTRLLLMPPRRRIFAEIQAKDLAYMATLGSL